jgi:hypothetical protein
MGALRFDTSVALPKFVIGYGILVQHFKQLGNDALFPISYFCPTALGRK